MNHSGCLCHACMPLRNAFQIDTNWIKMELEALRGEGLITLLVLETMIDLDIGEEGSILKEGLADVIGLLVIPVL
ncbi:hypothetical protein KSX_52630 [Ktedonospora formicarum]|uniref:Uncharacterized protein n=1 Tax=Ktedonospora formicarum TaxID=2778364 RepID=A0A8J3I5H1_9CHLR|nr:hypothetical protein KSX_52630 [Ktedonospora formicarum]